MDGDRLVLVLSALANPRRLRIIAELSRGSTYVSQLARDMQLSRPLVHMHLQRLEAAGLVEGHLELSEDSKAMRYYVVTDFAIHVDAAVIAEAARTLTLPEPSARRRRGKNK